MRDLANFLSFLKSFIYQRFKNCGNLCLNKPKTITGAMEIICRLYASMKSNVGIKISCNEILNKPSYHPAKRYQPLISRIRPP